MGSWLAIYIWLMSNKHIHQTKIFFFLLLCWPNIFLLQILSPSSFSNLYLVFESRINSRICLGHLALFIMKIQRYPNCDHSHQLQRWVGGISLGRRKGRLVATICHPLSDRLGLLHLYFCFYLYLYLYFCNRMAFSLRPTQTITFVFALAFELGMNYDVHQRQEYKRYLSNAIGIFPPNS